MFKATPTPSQIHAHRAAARFRHVVFADSMGHGGRAVDLAPRGDQADPASAPLDAQLCPDDESFVRWLFRRCDLDFRCYRPETLNRRLPACLRVLRVASVAQAKVLLERNPAMLPDALSTMVIGVTSFFRDPPVFQALAESILPPLALRPGPARVMSVGCSEGCELYSVAMLLGACGGLDGAELLGTDCRIDALARAATGAYDGATIRSVPAEQFARYFTPAGDERWRIDARLRSAAQWRAGDALALADAGEWDIILCRNLAMYLDPADSTRLWKRLERALRPGGFLVLGKAERPGGATSLVPLAPCIYRRAS